MSTYTLTYMGVEYVTNHAKGLDSGQPIVLGVHGDSRDNVGLLGDADNDPNDPSLDRSKAAMWQGATRYARGLHYAKDHNLAPVIVPGGTHSASVMFRSPAGAEAIFGGLA